MKYLEKTIYTILYSFLIFFLCSSCKDRYDYPIPPNSFEEAELPPPSKVTLSEESGYWQLYRDGEPYYIRGVAASAPTYQSDWLDYYYGMLADYGGNTIRTYAVDETTRKVLDAAYVHGVAVCVGLWVNKESQGFDYTNVTAVQQQLYNLRQQVRQLKDHPALLMWIVGNEPDAQYESLNHKEQMWKAVNDICAMIKEEEGLHPTTTAIINASQEKLGHIMQWAPNIDILSSNAKENNIAPAIANIKAGGWTKPFILSEYGPRSIVSLNNVPGRVLEWGALVEQTSSEKEEDYRKIYQDYIAPNKENNCIGSFAFLWGYLTRAQDQVMTWYGLHTPDGHTFGGVDALQYCWTGQYPSNRAPVIASRADMLLNGKRAEDNIKIAPGSNNQAKVTASDPDGDPLEYEWLISEEGAQGPDGGPHPGISGLIQTNGNSEVTFTAPSPGAYRLYVYVKDNNNKVANAVIPFLVE